MGRPTADEVPRARPADPAVVPPPYLLTLAFFLAHVLEEHVADFRGGSRAPCTCGGPAFWIAGATALKRRHPVGDYLAWFVFAGMILGEPAHVLVFPFVEGGRHVSVRFGRGDERGWASYVRAHDPPDHVA